MSLKEYRRKRKFDQTPEPKPSSKTKASKGLLRFVVQKHAASRTHYDFRLEWDGSLKSWAVPKGPTLTSQDPRLAVHVEEHPLEYGRFEGVIPKGNYGAGTVMIWDAGTFVERGSSGRADSEAALRKGFEKGHLTFVLHGEKLNGEFALIKIKSPKAEANAWLLVKKHDAHATRVNVLDRELSVTTGRTMEQIAAQSTKKGDIWLPGKGSAKKLKALQEPARRKTPSVKNKPGQTAELPRKTRAMEPVFAVHAPKDSGWIFEKFATGFRTLAEVEPHAVHLYSRARLPLEKKYPDISAALKKLGLSGLLDGEIEKRGPQFHFVISDLLFLNGKDFREKPLTERKNALSKLKLSGPLRLKAFTRSVNELEEVTRGVQIVAKKTDSLYHSGLSRDWLRLRYGGSPRAGAGVDPEAKPPLTHLDKIFWPKEKITKGDLVKYYESIAPLILPYLIDRPQSLHRQPNGLKDEGFFHKDMTGFLPRRVATQRVFSKSSGKTINYVLCQDLWALLYLVNLGCIEFNPWLSRRQNLENPDFVVIDLDPDDNPMKDIVKVALEVRKVLKAVGAESFCKTSGASGLHICVPTQGKFDFDTGRKFAEAVCRIVHKKFPTFTSVERNPARRTGKIYLDFLQNRRGQTLAAPYCVRPRPGATVSTPLRWAEVKPTLKVSAFTIWTLSARLKKVGDLWKPLLNSAVDIEGCMARLSKRFHT